MSASQKIRFVSKTLKKSRSNAPKATKYYAVVGGKNGFNGIVSSWDACEKLVQRVKNCRHKSFTRKEEAEQFIQQLTGKIPLTNHPPSPLSLQQPSYSCSNSVKNREEEKLSSTTTNECLQGKPILRLYTDGACTCNGKDGAKGGYGVYFGENDPRNISKPLLGSIQTNQRAELSAMIAALESVCKEPILQEPEAQIIIYTDSKYVKDILTAGWLEQWKKNNWKRKLGELKNVDLVQRLDCLWEKVTKEGKAKLEIVWVKGHDGIKGNEEADKLATKGISEGSQQEEV